MVNKRKILAGIGNRGCYISHCLDNMSPWKKYSPRNLAGLFQCPFKVQALFFHVLLCGLDFVFMFFVQSYKQPARYSNTAYCGENTAVPAFRLYEKFVTRN
jgi:hypothetical protein